MFRYLPSTKAFYDDDAVKLRREGPSGYQFSSLGFPNKEPLSDFFGVDRALPLSDFLAWIGRFLLISHAFSKKKIRCPLLAGLFICPPFAGITSTEEPLTGFSASLYNSGRALPSRPALAPLALLAYLLQLTEGGLKNTRRGLKNTEPSFVRLRGFSAVLFFF